MNLCSVRRRGLTGLGGKDNRTSPKDKPDDAGSGTLYLSAPTYMNIKSHSEPCTPNMQLSCDQTLQTVADTPGQLPLTSPALAGLPPRIRGCTRLGGVSRQGADRKVAVTVSMRVSRGGCFAHELYMA